MSWLSPYTKRIQLTITPAGKIDSDLTNFPIRLNLSSVSGVSGQDITDIFTELGANSKKIAVTISDGITETYVEIELWDNGANKAELWIIVPSVSSSVDTVLYFYYGPTVPDNTSFVGLIGEAPAQQVWDSNFVMVYHMNQDPSGGSGAIKDSTSNVNNGTSAGSMIAADLLDGQIGKGLDFDGVDDYLTSGTGMNAQFATNSSYSWFATAKTQNNAGNKIIISNTDWSSPYIGNGLLIESDGDMRVDIGENASNLIRKTYTGTLEDNLLHYVGYTYDGSFTAAGLNLYLDGLPVATTTGADTVSGASTSSTNLQIAGRDGANELMLGLIDEVRFSNIVRVAAWIKGDNYSNVDNLVTYGNVAIIGTLEITQQYQLFSFATFEIVLNQRYQLEVSQILLLSVDQQYALNVGILIQMELDQMYQVLATPKLDQDLTDVKYIMEIQTL